MYLKIDPINEMLLIDKKIFRRAKRGIKNSPFNLIFFQSLMNKSLSSQDVLMNKSKYLYESFLFLKSSTLIENEFLKLIKIGVLRREVDGQGLTSKVRITPIGRKVIESNSDLFTQKNKILQKLITCLKSKFTKN